MNIGMNPHWPQKAKKKKSNKKKATSPKKMNKGNRKYQKKRG